MNHVLQLVLLVKSTLAVNRRAGTDTARNASSDCDGSNSSLTVQKFDRATAATDRKAG